MNFDKLDKLLYNGLFEDVAGTAERKTRELIRKSTFSTSRNMDDFAVDENGKFILTLTGKKQTWVNYIEYKFRDEFIHAGINQKYEPGAFRIAVDELNWNQSNQDNSSISKLKQLLKFVSVKENPNDISYDLNGLTFDDLMEKYGEDLANAKKEIAAKAGTGKCAYKITRINSFAESKTYRSFTNADSHWCLTYDKDNWNTYTNNNANAVYFLFNKDFSSVKKENMEKNSNPLDAYGLSMLCAIVDTDGELLTCTSRWNHDKLGLEVPNADNVLDEEGLNKLLGVDYHTVCKPYTSADLEAKGILTMETVLPRIKGKSLEKLIEYVRILTSSNEDDEYSDDDEDDDSDTIVNDVSVIPYSNSESNRSSCMYNGKLIIQLTVNNKRVLLDEKCNQLKPDIYEFTSFSAYYASEYGIPRYIVVDLPRNRSNILDLETNEYVFGSDTRVFSRHCYVDFIDSTKEHSIASKLCLLKNKDGYSLAYLKHNPINHSKEKIIIKKLDTKISALLGKFKNPVLSPEIELNDIHRGLITVYEEGHFYNGDVLFLIIDKDLNVIDCKDLYSLIHVLKFDSNPKGDSVNLLYTKNNKAFFECIDVKNVKVIGNTDITEVFKKVFENSISVKSYINNKLIIGYNDSSDYNATKIAVYIDGILQKDFNKYYEADSYKEKIFSFHRLANNNDEQYEYYADLYDENLKKIEVDFVNPSIYSLDDNGHYFLFAGGRPMGEKRPARIYDSSTKDIYDTLDLMDASDINDIEINEKKVKDILKDKASNGTVSGETTFNYLGKFFPNENGFGNLGKGKFCSVLQSTKYLNKLFFIATTEKGNLITLDIDIIKKGLSPSMFNSIIKDAISNR